MDTLSGGTLRITMMNQWGDYAPGAEAQLVRAVAAGTVDLGWASSRVFDTLGIRSWQALSAPMLIDSYPLENAVLRSGMPGRMLAGLSKIGVAGLGVLGERLRLPFSAHRPLLAPVDWRGVSFGTYRSGVQEQAIRALGATPVVAFGPYRLHYLARGEIQGFELDIRRYVRDVGPTGTMYVTANMALWPQFDVLIANPRLARVPHRPAARMAPASRRCRGRGDSVALAASGSAAYLRQACAIGARFVTATPADLAAMRRSLSAVYQNLETDQQTRAFIQQIQRLKAATPPGPPLRIPARLHPRTLTRGRPAPGCPVQAGPATDGITATTRVPLPGGLSTVRVPPSVSTRSASPRSPVPRIGSAPPVPSSATSTLMPPESAPTETVTCEADAYFATFASASAQMKYAHAAAAGVRTARRHRQLHSAPGCRGPARRAQPPAHPRPAAGDGARGRVGAAPPPPE